MRKRSSYRARSALQVIDLARCWAQHSRQLWLSQAARAEENDLFTFTVTEQAADYILKTLAQRPFAEVVDLMNDLVRQLQTQQAPARAP